MTDEPVLPRYGKVPRRFDGGAYPHRFTSPEDRYRQSYLETIDHANGEIEKRFDQSELFIVHEVELLLIDAANGEDIPEIPNTVVKYFQGKIDLVRLRIQLLMLSDAVRAAFAGSTITVTKVTYVRAIADILNQSEMVKGMLSEDNKLLQAYLTFPVTSATAETSFSSLRQIKTFLRSSMTHQRLNNLFLLYVYTA